jgi:hypothetical protein
VKAKRYHNAPLPTVRIRLGGRSAGRSDRQSRKNGGEPLDGVAREVVSASTAIVNSVRTLSRRVWAPALEPVGRAAEDVAPGRRATSAVSSVEPSSTTMISAGLLSGQAGWRRRRAWTLRCRQERSP